MHLFICKFYDQEGNTMKATFRKYNAEQGFLRVRDFLKETYFAFGKPINWGLERWNWGRYHPSMFDGRNPAKTAENIRFWKGAVGLWENDAGQIVGVVNTEQPVPVGEAYFQQRPHYDFLLAEMFAYAEATLVDPKTGTLRIPIYDYDEPLQTAAEKRGYHKNPDSLGHNAEFLITELPQKNLPEGFEVCSMAEGGNPELRCKVQGLGFDHPDPAVWMTPAEYKEVQQAPDYRQDFDLYVMGPDGEYVTCCIIWYDDVNNIGFFEPVCTHPDFRRRGFGREVMMEGIRRIAALGATKAYVGSSQQFYKSIGFQMKYATYWWTKEF
jgi:GNAT superfamily N-acetyltransferase